MTFLTSDRLKIFISSTLTECVKERLVAKNAVESLKHQAVMFEAAGARAFPPRSVYLSALDEIHIFIGIYKEEYGYVADGMSISGVEDEYRFATRLGHPRLLYVKRNCSRNSRLEKLVSEMMGPNVTVGQYDDPDDLYETLRNDIPSLVAEYFLIGLHSNTLIGSSAKEVVDQLVPAERRVDRTEVNSRLYTELSGAHLVLVTGPVGSGKTVLLAGLSAQHGWIYVQCGDRTPREVLSEVANALRKRLGLDEQTYSQLEEARKAIEVSWQTLESITVVFDSVSSDELAEIVVDAMATDSMRRIVLSSRESFSTIHAREFQLVPFSRNEVAELIAKNRREPPTPDELEKLTELSAGNPLYLRYYVSGNPGDFEASLRNYELKALSVLSPRAREALYYLALSPRAIQLEQLWELMSSESGTAEEISELLSNARHLVNESSVGYTLFHPHLRKTISDKAAESPQLHHMYAKRLARWYETKRNYSTAFVTLENAGVEISRRLLEVAARHAAVQGDVTVALRILKRQIEVARTNADFQSQRDLLVSQAQMLSHAGKTDDALATLEEAEKLTNVQDSFVPLAEVRLSVLAWSRGDISAMEELVALKRRYLEEGREWDAGRIAFDLSAYHIRRADYREAAAEAEFAKKIFETEKDEYGMRIAKLNLMQAYSALPGKENEVNVLMRELEDQAKTSPRHRAALCNLLARRARENDDIEAAKKYSSEAVEIGRQLGDVNVICVNLVNLGNALKQEGKLEDALAQYEAADKIAHESKLVQQEAWAQHLIASVFNLKGDGNRSIQHAIYAIGLVKNGGSKRTEIEANEELAKGYQLTGKRIAASEAWLRVAELEFQKDNSTPYGSDAFLRAARILQKDIEFALYLKACRTAFPGQFVPVQSDLSNGENLVVDLPTLVRCLPPENVFEGIVYHARMIFHKVPILFARQVLLRSISSLSEYIREGNDVKKHLLAMLGLIMSAPSDSLSLADLVKIARRLSHRVPYISFRAHEDGAAHWAIETKIGRPVVITISQMDDKADVFLVSLCISLMFLAFSEDISEEVLVGVEPTRSEASFQIGNYNEIKKLVPLDKIGLDVMEDTIVVTRATDPKNDPSMPIVIITRDDITQDWTLGTGKGNSGQIMFGKALIELVYHLFEGEISLESLRPKIVSVVRKTII